MSDCFEATDTPDSSKNASTMETAGDQVAWKTTVLALSHSSNGTQSASGVFGTHGKAIDHGVQANAVKTYRWAKTRRTLLDELTTAVDWEPEELDGDFRSSCTEWRVPKKTNI
ncbi:hypothetical protein L596_004837 [Steinernema carpocapsae]|uniref:Uncharacterized protein n=1 Tax=Steinernema carpocapsae TaxID=34508 RepID=A0A4U8UXA9_STECR|nr:hypothetical protein L596_004837 [Steinernema carpocapsae]